MPKFMYVFSDSNGTPKATLESVEAENYQEILSAAPPHGVTVGVIWEVDEVGNLTKVYENENAQTVKEYVPVPRKWGLWGEKL